MCVSSHIQCAVPEMYGTKLEFPERWGVQIKKPSVGGGGGEGGVWIFSGAHNCTLAWGSKF